MTPARSLDDRVRRYYAFQVLVAFQIWSPFWTIWLFDHFSFFLGTIVDVIFWIVSLLVAIPAGAFADRYGRKRAVVLGVAIWLGGIVGFGLSGSFATFALSNAVWAFGAGFLWGAGSAYLYDTLVEVRAEGRYPAVTSRVALYSYLGTAIACVVGAALVWLSARIEWTLLAYAVPGLGALVLGITFQEPDVPRRPEPSLFRQMAAGWRTARANRQIVLVILFQVLVGFVSYMMALFRAVFLNQSFGGDVSLSLGAATTLIPGVVVVALVYAFFFLFAAASGGLTNSILDRFGESGGLLLVFILIFAPFPLIYLIAQGAFPGGLGAVLAVATQLPDYIVWGVEAVLITTIINRRIGSDGRATVLAIESFASTLVIVIMEPLAGIAATDYSLGTGLAFGAVVASVPAAYILTAYRRLERTAGAPILAGARSADDEDASRVLRNP